MTIVAFLAGAFAGAVVALEWVGAQLEKGIFVRVKD